ncbi:hypothetical protein SH2C18_40260 [Clostridium sediminicola]
MAKNKKRKNAKKYESKAQNPNYKEKTKDSDSNYIDPVNLD